MLQNFWCKIVNFVERTEIVSRNMSALRAFRFQKSRPVTSSPGSVVSETADSPASDKTLVNSQNGENGGGDNSQKLEKLEEDSEDIVRPPVSSRFDHFIVFRVYPPFDVLLHRNNT